MFDKLVTVTLTVTVFANLFAPVIANLFAKHKKKQKILRGVGFKFHGGITAKSW